MTIRPAVTAAPTREAARRRVDGEVDQLARILLAAYADTPDSTWLIKDRDERLAVYAAYWPAVVRYAIAHGTVDVAADQDGAISGTAIWFNTTTEPTDTYEQLLTATCGAHADRFHRLHHLLTDDHTDHESAFAVWRLGWLAVARDQQCQGIGSTLLGHRHTILDTQRSPAWLTATTSGACDLFTRHGYTPRQAALRLKPGGRTSVWPMAREPATPPPHPATRRVARRT